VSTKQAIRKAHFLGTKIRNLRKRNNLTMDDLSARCIKIDPEAAPSVSYLSMIERGKRHPSAQMMQCIANVFQKDLKWFLDDVPEESAIVPEKGSRGGISGMALEPGFLFSNDILQIAIPEMLSQTGVSGRQFAHLLIRAHQETNQNHFPDLERAAEAVGKKQMPITTGMLIEIAESMGLKIKWFKAVSEAQKKAHEIRRDMVVRSFFEAPSTIHINQSLKAQPARLKYDLAVYIGHKTLHEGDGVKSVMYAGPPSSTPSRNLGLDVHQSSALDSKDIVHAWRDFECSFFAGALLCPKVPFRRLLEQRAHEISVANMIDVSTSLHAVYRGNGIPLPWGNMRMVQDPCAHWAVFRLINSDFQGSSSQISVLDVGDQPHIYCCESIRVDDVSGSNHVLCAGIDINPAIESQGGDAATLAESLKSACISGGGETAIPKNIRAELESVGKLLNIAWIERGVEKDARLICPRSAACPRRPSCHGDCE